MTNVNGLPEDAYVNDFAFRFTGGGAPTDADLLLLLDAVDTFYNDALATGDTVSDFIGEAVSRAATHEMQFFTISTGGSPRLTENWLGPAAPATLNVNLPTEVAAVVSFHGDLTGVLEEVGATRPRARRRGRVYVGPLTTDAVSISADNPLLGANFRLAMQEGIIHMADQAAAADFTFSVWSRAANELYAVVGGWTDNAPDTQRRRGLASTSRTTFSV